MSDDAKMKNSADNPENEDNELTNFIWDFIDEDIAPGGKYHGMQVHTRFPPEPNGFLHIGHAKALFINFETAKRYGGLCNLRMDDTNPDKEDDLFVQAIKDDVHWLGYDWGDRFYYASDYFPKMYEAAVELIKKDLAFVDELSADEIRETRGTLTEPGQESPWRDRPIEESLDLFERMKNGEFPDGSYTLRAKIDMSSGNMNMRDPVLYRISHQPHHRTKDKWCIYPMYDFAHTIEDAMEGITHSLCSLEFEDHRPLYNWVRDNVTLPSSPRQIEFARLNINYTVMSKRKLRALIEEGLVDGWDDPRLPTLRGLRRRGFTPEAIKQFMRGIGVTKQETVIDYAFLEHCIRDDLNKRAERRMAVLDPIELEITNYPDDKTEMFEANNNPEDKDAGTREISFSKHLWIERSDFMVDPFKKYYRLYPGNEVRLMNAYFVTCTGYDEDDDGNITKVYAEYDPASRGGSSPDGRKVRGTIHWVDQKTAMDAEVRMYDRLFIEEDPDAADDYHDVLNPDSLVVIPHAKLEASLQDEDDHATYQFMRKGYFCRDSKDSSKEQPVFNLTATLRDTFNKKKNKKKR